MNVNSFHHEVRIDEYEDARTSAEIYVDYYASTGYGLFILFCYCRSETGHLCMYMYAAIIAALC